MILEEKQQVTTVKEVTIGYKCDICGNKSEGSRLPNDWIEITHGHHEWGNDSIESLESFHLCSPKCYLQQIKRSTKELKDYRSGEISSEMSITFANRLLDYTKDLL